MALIVTPGAADADSYATVAVADAYHTARGNAAWTGTDVAKEAALRRATAWLDGAYRPRLPGLKRYARVQALEWPRVDAFDIEGNLLDADTVPPEVVQATCEAALREVVSAGSLSPDVTPGTVKVLTGVGSLSWTPLRTAAGASDMAPTLLAVERLLSGLVRGDGMGLVVRA